MCMFMCVHVYTCVYGFNNIALATGLNMSQKTVTVPRVLRWQLNLHPMRLQILARKQFALFLVEISQ